MPDARAGEVELLVPVDPGKLRRLAADERDARLAADLGRALDELGDLLEVDPVRGDVVEEEERVGAAGQDVVDAVRGEVGAAVAERAARAREDQLRADRVRGRGQQARLVERMQAGERAEPGRAGRLDGRAKPLDDGVGLRDRDARRPRRSGARSPRSESTVRGGQGSSLTPAGRRRTVSPAWTSRPC